MKLNFRKKNTPHIMTLTDWVCQILYQLKS